MTATLTAPSSTDHDFLTNFDFAASTAIAHKKFAGYIVSLLKRYKKAQEDRKSRRLKTVAFCGHGRCGKDTAAEYLAQISPLLYGGAVSTYVLPMIADAIGLPEAEAWNRRHEDSRYGRLFWYTWCNVFRKADPAIFIRMMLGDADIVPGMRAEPEFFAVMAEGLVDVPVWIERPGNPVDPTMGFTREQVLSQPNAVEIVNDGSLNDFHAKIASFACQSGIPLFGSACCC